MGYCLQHAIFGSCTLDTYTTADPFNYIVIDTHTLDRHTVVDPGYTIHVSLNYISLNRCT